MMKITLKWITCRWNGLANRASKPVYVLTSHLPYVIDNRDNITILTVYETVWVLKYRQTEPLSLRTYREFLLFVINCTNKCIYIY